MSLVGICLMFSSWSDCRYVFSRGRPWGYGAIFITLYQDYKPQHGSLLLILTWISWMREVFPSFEFLSINALWKEDIICSIHLMEWGVTLHVLERGISAGSIWNSFAQAIFLIAIFKIYPITYLYQHEFMDTYFILWVAIQHSFAHWELFRSAWRAFTNVLVFCCCCLFFSTSYFLALQGSLGLSCIFSVPVLESAIPPRSSGSFILEKGVRSQYLGVTAWLSHLSLQLRLRSWSCDLWFRAPRQALCWQLRAWSWLQILYLPLSLPLPFSHSLSLSKIKINIKKNLNC